MTVPKGEFPAVDVSVAWVLDQEGRLLLILSQTWNQFTLPMTKRRLWGHPLLEPPRQAAERAGAEILGVPVIVDAQASLAPSVYLSGRDGELKAYRYIVCPTRPHPRFRNSMRIARPHLWLTPAEVLSGEYRPISATCLAVTRLHLEKRLDPETR